MARLCTGRWAVKVVEAPPIQFRCRACGALKQAENLAKTTADANRARKQRILEIIDTKNNEAMSQKSVEELQAELAKL